MNKKNITKSIITAAVFLMLFISHQAIFAGDSGCQSGRLSYQYKQEGSGGRQQSTAKRQEQFQAAQVRNGDNQPPQAGGSIGGDSPLRSRFSYFASVFFLLCGIWLLFSLLRTRVAKRFAPKSAPLAKIWNFALKPSFALSTFALLFAAVIIGGVLTSPTVTSAQKNDLNDREQNATNGAAITHLPVFKSAQQFGGDNGTTQIGTPVFDVAGNYYVRGAFSGTMTLGTTVLTSTQGLDLFFAKYDANDNLLWARQGSGVNNAPFDDLSVEGVTALSLDGGYVYLAGSFVKTLTLQGGANPNVTLNDNGTPGYNYETFVAKYDLDGNLQWARGGNSGSPKNPNNLETGQNAINKFVFDRGGTPYVAGIISGGNFLGTPISNFYCSNGQPCANQGKSDILLASLDQNTGAPLALKTIGGSGDDNALDLAVDNVTNELDPQFYMVGNFDSPSIVFRASGGGTVGAPAGSINSFILKFNGYNISSGTPNDGVWVKVLQNDGIVGVNQIVTDSVSGLPYITGYYKGTLTGPAPFPIGTLTISSNRPGTNETALAGYVASVERDNGSFGNLMGLGGVGNALTISPGGNIFVVGSLWDTGTFTGSTGLTRTIDSVGDNDLFVTEVNKFNFTITSIKAVAGTGSQGLVAAGNPSTTDGGTKNNYSPLGIALDRGGRVVVSGDFSGALSLDCITLKTTDASRHAYIAKLLINNETSSCRIRTNNEPNYRNWLTPSNWNDGVIPAAGDSVYVPYRREAIYNPIYNTPDTAALRGLSISENQTVILEQNLFVNDRLDLIGGRIDAGNKQLTLGPPLEAYSANGGRVIGKVQKLLFGMGDPFTFPVGTEDGYSPVTISNYNAGKGATFAVTARQGEYPFTANNLPANRAARWWNLTNGGLVRTDLTFQYLSGDITTGIESGYRAYRLPTGGGDASLVAGTINTTTKTVSVPNVSQFSDWTLAQSFVPTAADISIGGRVYSTGGVGISNAQVVLTDQNGQTRIVQTNGFGYFRFDDLPAGAAYVVGVTAKRYQFAPQIISPFENVTDLTFTATN